MRSLVIILLLISVFALCSLGWESFINKEFDNVVNMIDNAENIADIEAIIEHWEKLSDKAEILIDHNDLEEVSEYLWAMRAEIKYDTDEFMESKQMAKDIIDHIRMRNSTKIINIL